MTKKYEYEIPFGIYKVTDGVINFNKYSNLDEVIVTFKGIGEQLKKVFSEEFINQHYPPLLNKEFKVLKFTPGIHCGFTAEIDENRQIGFSLKDFDCDFKINNTPIKDIYNYIEQIKYKDISKEYSEIMNSLYFGYPEHNVYDSSELNKFMKELIKQFPDSFLFTDELKKHNKTCHFPTVFVKEEIQEFKDIASKLVTTQNNIDLLNSFFNDLEIIFDNKYKPKTKMKTKNF